MVMVAVVGVGTADAVTHSDDFNYNLGAPAGLQATNPTDWGRRGDKTEWIVGTNNQLSAPAGQNSNWSIISEGGAGDPFQKVSLDFQFTYTPNAFSAGWLTLTLNQDWGNSGFFQNENAYTLLIRSQQDMFMGRDDAANAQADVWGWEGNAANPQYSLTGLQTGVWYTGELEKNGSVLTGRIWEGNSLIASVSFDEAGTVSGERTGGRSGFVNHYQDNNDWLALDNYNYMSIPEPVTMALLGLGGLALARRRRS
jgi:hypothetical protein